MKVLQTFALVSCFLASFTQAKSSNDSIEEKKICESRRRLLSSTEEPWEAQSNECNEVMYHLFLHVENHLMLLSVPEEGAPQACQPLAFHNKASGKTIEIISDSKALVSLLGDSLQIQNGESFTLSELETAFDRAHDVVFDDDYNVINHNCAELLFDMSHELDIAVTDSMIDFVVGKLVQGGNIAAIARSADNLSELELSSEELEDDFVIVDALVKRYAETHSW